MIQKLRQGIGGLFYGWRMVAIGCAMRMLGGGFHLYGFTIFFLPITQELGLSRAATSLVFCLARAEGAIEGPLASYLIDRLGPRPMIDARWRHLIRPRLHVIGRNRYLLRIPRSLPGSDFAVVLRWLHALSDGSSK